MRPFSPLSLFPSIRLVCQEILYLWYLLRVQCALSKKFFGSDFKRMEIPPWNKVISEMAWFYTQWSFRWGSMCTFAKKIFSFRRGSLTPKLNPKCRSVLRSNSLVKRDDHSSINQDVSGRSFLRFWRGQSLIYFGYLALFPEVHLTIFKFNDDAKILANLSTAKIFFIISPCLERFKLSLL